MKHLLRYLLEVEGLRAVKRAVKNIFDYGMEIRLQKLYGELDRWT